MGPFVTRAAAKLKEWGPDKCLAALLGVLVFLLLVQGVRCGATGIMAKGLAASLKGAGDPPPKRDDTDGLDHYDVILDKGLLGERAKEAAPPPPKLFGIMGRAALLGSSPDDAKPYEVGAEVPGGEKIVKIGTNEVVLEKEGEQRTLKVFPDVDDQLPEEAGPPAPPSAPDAKDVGKDGPPEEAPPAKEAAEAESAGQGSSAGGITAETLVGTKWSFQGSTISFYADGQFKVDDAVDGTWRIEGNTITVNVMGEEHTAQIEGDKIIVEGKELERVE